MKEFDRLLEIIEALLGPEGCPWDKEQTIASMRTHFLEESHELLEAMDMQDFEKIQEEMGDCLFALVFIAELAERQGKFPLSEALCCVSDKLIRRHPHIFGELKLDSTEEVLRNWEEIKKKEGKKNPIDGIPPSLPALARAQKVVQKIRRAEKQPPHATSISSEEDLGNRLWALVQEAAGAGIDAESALRQVCFKQEGAWKSQSEKIY